MVKHEIPIIIDSNIIAGAINKSADGSSFEIVLEDAIQIPKTATSCTVSVQEALIWNVVPNILTGENDAFSINDGVNPTFNIVVPQGLYDLNTLEASLDSAIVAAGGASGIFSLIGDSATQKVVIRINVVGVTIDFTIANSIRNILGFNSIILGPTIVIQTDFIGNTQAAFNTIDYFIISSNIVNRGMRINNNYNQHLSTVLIDQEPGSQLVSRPFNPPKIPAWELIGARRNRIRFWLTNQNNILVNTNNENWSARLSIEYTHDVEEAITI